MDSQIRLLIISDTHGTWPYSSTESAPKADVLLHCGDLTQVGGLPSFKRAIEDIKSTDVELKLVIAGNHDLELDEHWVRGNMEDDEDLRDHTECVSYMKSQKQHGLHYLDEGTYTFTLKDARKFSIYASPYTPEFNGYAFAYGKDVDRFNQGATSVPENVDIVMTHGPPLFRHHPSFKLDISQDGTHCGCEKLMNAIHRARPRLHCFGHLHEGRGAVRVEWGDSGSDAQPESALMKVLRDNDRVLEVRKETKGSETLLVNAAIHGSGRGRLVELDL